MAVTFDWEALARDIGSLTEQRETGSSAFARRAIEVLLGEERLRGAVDYYVTLAPGSELARNVLWQIRPWSAMERCYELYQTSDDIEVRRSAIELLRVVGDPRVVLWIHQFLNDSDPGIQAWGAGILDQLLWSGQIQPEPVADLLAEVEQHPNEEVRGTAAFIRQYLARREHMTFL